MSKENRAKQITILVIDDKTGFVKESLEPVGRDTTPKIKLEHRTNLAEGRKVLEENKSIAGVILDVKCRLSPNDIDDPAFIVKALDVMKSSFPDMPRVILTGEPGMPVQLKTFHNDEMVFEKREDDIEKMFAHLIKCAADNDYLKIARRYKDIFDLFDNGYDNGYFDETTRNDLYLTIKTMHHKDSVGDNLRRIRLMEEAIFHALYKFDKTIIPLEYLDRKYNADPKNEKKRSDIVNYLCESGHIEGKDSIVFKAGELVQRITSHNANHKQLVTPKFPPTIYTVQMCVFAALDLFLWFKGIVK